MKAGRHSTVQITERHYAYLAPKNLRSAIDRLENLVIKPVIKIVRGNSAETFKFNRIMVPKGGVEPPWYQVPRDFESDLALPQTDAIA